MILQANNILKSFGPLDVLKSVSLSVERGEIVSIIGPSGSGKSTLLRCLCCLERIGGGEILIDGERLAWEESGRVCYPAKNDLRRLRGKLSMVFQNFNLFPHLSVLQNLTIAPVSVLGVPRAQAEARAKELLDRVSLSAKAASYPCELSGGQQQRVAIARALAMNPEILCFDEPTSALDPELTGEVLNTIREIAQDGERRTMIIVTHEMAFARELSDKIVFMDNGVALAAGSPAEILDNPAEPRIQAFLKTYGN